MLFLGHLAMALAQEQPAEEPVTTGPAILQYVEATYPPEALAAGIEAVVKLRIRLDETGAVETVEVVEPVGQGFDEAAVDAVLAMQFSPAQTASGPIAVEFEFDYGFVLSAAAEPAPVEDTPPPITLEGLVREMGSRQPVAGLQIGVPSLATGVTTDEQGQFALAGIPPGTWEVRLSGPGFVERLVSLEVVEGQVTRAELWIKPEAWRENEVVATYQPPKEEVTRRSLTIEEVRRIPGTFGDPVKVIQTLPGAARSPFGTGLLIIRGSNPEDSGVYIDGVRVPIIYHLTGTTSVLQPDLIEAVDYLPGGYGVQFGRTMGGTIDLRTRTDFSEQGRLTWGTDILDSNVYYESRVGRGKQDGIAMGVRRSYVDLFIPIFTSDTGFVLKPRYWDYQAKWARNTGDRKLSAFWYGFDDLLEVGTPEDTAQGSDQDTQGDLRTKYNSHRLIFSYEHTPSEQLRIRLTPSLGVDSNDFGLGQEFSLRGSTWIGQFRAEVAYQPTPHVELIPGADLIGSTWKFDFASAVSFADLDDPLAERDPVGFGGTGSLWSPDVFFKANLRPLADPDRWLLTPGVRANVVTLFTQGEVAGEEDLPPSTWLTFDPRLGTRFQVNERFALKAGSGVYHQPPQPQEIVGVGVQASVRPEVAYTHSIGWEQRLSNAVFYDVEAYYRQMEDQIVFNEAWAGFGTGNPFINGGLGRAYGVEVILRHDPIGRFFGWASYTLSRSRRLDDPKCGEKGRPSTGLDKALGNGPCWYPFDFDQTHIFSAQGGYDLPAGFGVSAQVQAVTGNPTSLSDAGVYDADGDFYNGFASGDPNQDRLPAFFQTSLRLDRRSIFRTWQLDTYIDFINAVRGVNPEFTVYDYDYSEAAYVRGLPFIPNLGIEAKFFL